VFNIQSAICSNERLNVSFFLYGIVDSMHQADIAN